jgi:hypothetical protein
MNNIPNEGQGFHQWLLMMSRDLLLKGYSVEEAIQELIRLTKHIDRTTQDVEGEITNAVEGAWEFLKENPNFIPKGSRRREWVDPLSFVGLDDPLIRKDRRPARLRVDVNLQKEAYRKSKGLDKKGIEEAESFDLHNLYARKNFLICFTMDQKHKPTIISLKEFKEYKGDPFQYMVPNPMRDRHYGRCDFGTGERLFMVVEFDEANFIEQIAYLVYLEKWTGFPLVMIVFSGNRSYHGWFACFGQSEHRCVTFSRKATQLGADRTTYSPSQYVRMPQGYNYKREAQQEVIYLSKDKFEAQYALLGSEF